MSETVTVGISDMKILRSPDILVTYALGSCVGICLYDTLTKVAGLGHIMLPNFHESSKSENQYRFADTCIPLMIKEMEKMGCNRRRFQAKIAGGAKMFQVSDDSSFGNIGKRNVIEVKNQLAKFQIRILAEDTGLNYGRTLFFYADDGKMVIKSFANGIKTF